MTSEAIQLAKRFFLKPFEGYHKKLPNGDCTAYPDPGSGNDPWTIGWGTTGQDVRPGVVWTEAQAEAALDREAVHSFNGLLKYSPGLITADSKKQAALLSFGYNCGLGNYRISTLRKRVNDKDWVGARQEILKWNKAAGRFMRGLAVRRTAESLFL